jgi:hypothetical protein
MTLSNYRVNTSGLTEVLIPGLQEYGLLVVPTQIKGGLVVRLTTGQETILSNLTQLQGIPKVLEGLKAIDSVLGELKNKIPASNSSADILKAIASFNASVSSKVDDTERISQLQIFLATWLSTLNKGNSDTIFTLSLISSKLDSTVKPVTDKLDSTTKLITDKIDSARQSLGDKIDNAANAIATRIDATNAALATLNQTLSTTLINDIDFQSVAMPQAQTEYAFPLPNGTKSFTLRCSVLPPVVAGDPPRAADIWYSLRSGQVVPASRGQTLTDGSLPRCRRLLALNETARDVSLNLTGKTLYLACATAGWTAEIDIGT